MRIGRKGRITTLIVSLAVIAVAILSIVFADQIKLLLGRFTDSLTVAGTFSDSLDDGEIRIHVIDVGQGDSILILTNEGVILIDAGPTESKAVLRAHLKACGIHSIDYFICTHPHDDHIGGAEMVIKNFKPDIVLLPDAGSDSFAFEVLLDAIEANKINALIPSLGSQYTLGDVTLKVLAPVTESEEINDMSLVIRMTHGDNSFIFTGDAEYNSELMMLQSTSAEDLDCDFLKVGHHGSETSSSKEFLEALTPSMAAISCARNNPYGHPRGEVLARLSEAGCKNVLRTDKMGSIVISSDGNTLTVISAQDGIH